jgi:addiction module HigA family antidote
MRPLSISANQLAEGLGVNRSTVGRLIAGEQQMTPRMAARLGAYFDVPARWWLVMQTEFDARAVAERPELSAGVTPIEIGPDFLLTPTGVRHLGEAVAAEPVPPLSLPRTELEKLPQGSAPERRVANVVRFDNGSVALVGDDT